MEPIVWQTVLLIVSPLRGQCEQLWRECRAQSPQQDTHTQTVGHTRVGVYQIPAFCLFLRQQLGKMSGVAYAGEETYTRVWGRQVES